LVNYLIVSLLIITCLILQHNISPAEDHDT
jgi:hypothetical protein